MSPTALAQAFPVFEFEQYLWIEERSGSKNEFYYGHVYGYMQAMAGGTENHSALKIAASFAFSRLLQGSACYVRDSDLLIETPSSNAGFYPDLSIHCNQKPQGKARTAKSPILILEVLSSTTRNYDLTTKRKEYFRIPSLLHYLVLDSETVAATLYSRQAEQMWPTEAQHFSRKEDCIVLSALGIELAIQELYRETDLLS